MHFATAHYVQYDSVTFTIIFIHVFFIKNWTYYDCYHDNKRGLIYISLSYFIQLKQSQTTVAYD